MGKVAKVIGAIGIGIGLAWATGGLVGAWSMAGIQSALTGTVARQLLTSVALTALSSAMRTQQQGPASAGIRAPDTARGDINPDSFILGRYATAGSHACPPYTHARGGYKVPNPMMNYVINLGGMPGQKLVGMSIDGADVEITDKIHGDYGNVIRVRGEEGHAWVRYYDGTQTAADPMLLNRYGNHSRRPWSEDMVGRGICYAIVTLAYWPEGFQGFPRVSFVVEGAGLYDPRRDSTVGGDGPQRWDDLTTHMPTENTAVQIYNLLRGIRLPGEAVYGGRARADQLPLANWMAAMDACDAPVDMGDGATEPAWRTSYEVLLSDEPASVIEELNKAASIQLTESGGTWRIRVGGPGVPVAHITDDDIVSTLDQTLDLFPSIDGTHNGVSISFPDPASSWKAAEAPTWLRSDYEAQDGGKRLVADLSTPAAPYADQVQRLARAYVEEERRFRRHVLTLPPDYGALEPLDSLEWSSAHHGYDAKVFEISAATTDPVTQLVTVTLRERDPEDYDWRPEFALPYSPRPILWPDVPEVAVDGFSVTGIAIADSQGDGRRPALQFLWGVADIEALTAIEWEVRLKGDDQPLRGSVTDVTAGGLRIVDGILPAEAYEARIQPRLRGYVPVWTDWKTATTPDVRVGDADLDDDVRGRIASALKGADAAAAAARDALQRADDVRTHADEQDALLREDIGRVGAAADAVRDDLAASAYDLARQIRDGADRAEAYTDAELYDYNSVIEGRFATVAGQIAELTAALTSDNLVLNGAFANGMMGWNGNAVVVVDREGSTDALVQGAPELHVARIGQQTNGSLVQTLSAFEMTPEERFQIRFAAALATARTLTAAVTWLDVSGATISVTSRDIAVGPVGQWRMYSLQLDAPEGTRGAILTLIKPQAGAPVFVTGIAASTVNVAIEAKIAELNAAQADLEKALATLQQSVTTRFADANTRISDEASARSSADGALGVRISEVETRTGDNTSRIGRTETAIATADKAIAQLRTDLSSESRAREEEDSAFKANVAQTYVTKTASDEAIAGAKEELRSSLTRTAPAEDFTDPDNWTSSTSGDPAEVGGVSVSSWTITLREARHKTTGGNSAYMLSKGVSPVREKDTVRISLRVHVDVGTGGEDGLYIIARWMDKDYKPIDPAQSNTAVSALTGRTSTVSADIEVPANAVYMRGGVVVRGARYGGSPMVRVQFLRQENITAAKDVEAGIRQDFITKVDADKAIASGLTEFDAGVAGGLRASVRTQSLAISHLTDRAQSSYVLRAQAGSGAAGIEITAWDDPDGEGGAVKLTGDNIIADGTLSTDKLVVGLGRNLIDDPLFRGGIKDWQFLNQFGSAGVFRLRGIGETWASPSAPTLMMFQGNGQTTGYCQITYHPVIDVDGATAYGVPCKPGEVIEGSAYLSRHRCGYELYLRFMRGSQHVSYVRIAEGGAVMGPSGNPDEWDRPGGRAIVPGDADTVTLMIRKLATEAGATDSYLFVHKPQLSLSHASAAQLAPFSGGGTTLIDGGQLMTDAVLARHVSAETMRAINGRFDSLQAANVTLGNAEVDTLQIRGNAVTIPVVTYHAGNQQFAFDNNGNRRHMIGQSTILREDFNTILTVSMEAYVVSENAGDPALHIKIYRGATEILAISNPVPSTPPRGRGGAFSYTFIDLDRGVGPTNYYLYADVYGTQVANFQRVMFYTQQVKR